MKPLRFKAWLIVDKKGEAVWELHPWGGLSRPRVFMNETDAVAKGGHKTARVDVTITPAKRAAKRGKP